MEPPIIVLLVVLAALVLFGLLLLVQRSRRKGSLKVSGAQPGTAADAPTTTTEEA